MKSKIYLFLFFVFAFSTCKKNDLKEPASVDFKMAINKEYNGSGNLRFKRGTILLSSIVVQGTRSEGDPVNFVRNFPAGLSLDLDGQNVVPELHFDLPQGTYTSLTVTCYTADSLGNNLIVQGEYETPNGSAEYDVLFEVDVPSSFELDTDFTSGTTLTLSKSSPMVATIKMDPLEWFKPVLAQSFNSANTRNVNNKATIPINKTENTNIFQVVVNRIDKGNKVIF